MVDKQKMTRRTAIGLVGAGGVLLATETLAFENITADRLTSLMTAGDENAYLALVEATYDTIPNNSFETVAYLTNNVDEALTVSYTLSTGEGGVRIRFDGQTTAEGGSLTGSITIAAGDAVPIELECSKPGQISNSPVLTVDVPEAVADSNSMTISDVTFELPFVCKGGPIIDISDVRGLGDHRSFQEITGEIDVTEINNSETSGLTVRLEIVGDSGGTVFDQTKSAPGDFPEIAGETITVSFDVGTLPEDSYTYTVTVDADNATEKTTTDTFLVDDELLIIDLAASRSGARDLGVNALNRSSEDVDLVAVAVDHDPDNEANRQRDMFEELEIVLNGTTMVFDDGGGAGLPGDGTRIDHNPVQLTDGQDGEYSFMNWNGQGNIKGETFEVTIWATDSDGVEVATTDRVTV